MRIMCVMLALMAIAAMVHAAEKTGEPAKAAGVKIVILGDSTVADYATTSTTRGWGQMIGEGFLPNVTIVNLAANGRSAKSFIKEKRLDKALAEKANYALIQFGHNDSHAKGRPEATDPNGDYSEYLREYVNAFRKGDTEPIFVTPMHRGRFEEGKVSQELLPYAQAMKRIAAEMAVPVVDLHTASGELYNRLGKDGIADLFCNEKDRTHFSPKGARAMAGMVLKGLADACPALKDIIKPEWQKGEPASQPAQGAAK